MNEALFSVFRRCHFESYDSRNDDGQADRHTYGDGLQSEKCRSYDSTYDAYADPDRIRRCERYSQTNGVLQTDHAEEEEYYRNDVPNDIRETVGVIKTDGPSDLQESAQYQKYPCKCKRFLVHMIPPDTSLTPMIPMTIIEMNRILLGVIFSL